MIDDKIKRKITSIIPTKRKDKIDNRFANNFVKGRSPMDEFTNDATFPHNVMKKRYELEQGIRSSRIVL